MAEKVKEFFSIEKFEEREYPLYHPKVSAMIYGGKGTSKTFLSVSVPGNVLVLSFENEDNVSDILKNYFTENARKRIVVKNFDPLLSEIGKTKLVSVNNAFEMLHKLLNSIPYFDWIVIDGYQKLVRIAELVMRYKNNLSEYEKFTDFSLWRVRNDYLDEIFNKVHRLSKHGVVINSHENDKINPLTKEVNKTATWLQEVKENTKTEIRTFSKEFQEGEDIKMNFFANIKNCKTTTLTGVGNITYEEDENKKVIGSPLYFWARLLTHKNEKTGLDW